MSKRLSRQQALDNISTWDTDEVLSLLRKNELEECCKAVAKRQIDGDELLHLTDGKLVLWKSDLTRSLIGRLWAFVQELNKSPENYALDKITEVERIQNDDHLNDSSSWGSSEFEDEVIEESRPDETREMIKPSLIKNKQDLLSRNNRISPGSGVPTYSPKQPVEQEKQEMYANCESLVSQDEEQDTYTNYEEAKPLPPRNDSKLHSQIENSLANKLKEELEELKRSNQDQATKKPVIGPKPQTLSSKKLIPIMVVDKKFPQKSFLHDAPRIHECVRNALREQNKTQRRMAVPPPPKPKNNKDYASMRNKKAMEKELPKPPPPPNLDLIANLPAQTETESEDEYEIFDESIIKQVQQMSRVGSKQSLHSGPQGSVESVYKPPSATSYEDEQDLEIYTCITETPDDDGYESPIQRINETQQRPPPLPAKPSPPSTLPNRTRTKLEKAKERSPDKKSPTVSLPNYNASLSSDRATRPLPPPPERNSYVDKPWFHNITRDQATTLIRDARTYNTPQDGYFLLRPSTTNPGNPLALVLWYRDRVYNVPVRKRADNRYALGSVKMNELSFSTIEDIVTFYMKEELMLYSSGIPTGSTRLTDAPPKQF